jgi:hypothetical protein
MELDVKDLFRDFWKSPEIPDYTDYQTITRIRNILKLEKNLCNHFLKSVKSRECAVAFQSSHENDLTKPSISIPYMQQNSSIGDPVV